MNIFTQNDKMKKFGIHAFGLEPRKNCVGCKCPCYGENGFYKVFEKRCKNRWQKLFEMSMEKWFVAEMIKEIRRRRSIKIIRIHDTSDFYSQAYLDKWTMIAQALPGIKFYCYTKALHLNWTQFDRLKNTNRIQSHGGEHDKLIDDSKPQAMIIKPGEKVPSRKWKITNDNELMAVNGYKYIALKQH